MADLPKPPMTGAEWFAGGRRIPYDPKSARVPTDEEATASGDALRVFERVVAADGDADSVWLTLLPGFPTAPTAGRRWTDCSGTTSDRGSMWSRSVRVTQTGLGITRTPRSNARTWSRPYGGTTA